MHILENQHTKSVQYKFFPRLKTFRGRLYQFCAFLKIKLKADRPHPRDYPHTSTNYRHTDKHLRQVMTAIALCCTRQSKAPNIDHCTPENRP